MENFFNLSNNSQMPLSKNLYNQKQQSQQKNQQTENNKNSLANQRENIKNNYERIFIEASESIRNAIDKFKPVDKCDYCALKKNCPIEKIDVFSEFPNGCPYREWQMQVVTFLTGEYKQKLKNTYKMLMDKKNECSCSQCGNCCRLAVSEYSYSQLKQRASRGDKFSRDFVSVFVPYETEEEAKRINPEYFELLNDLLEDSKIYYYYCPKLKDNLCSDYENRPDICKNFPHNPLKLLPSSCSYNAWKDEMSHQSMLLKAKVDIIEFYKNKLG